MTLFNLARKNIQRNFSSYFLYIASMVFSIVIYFTFVTLKYNNDISELTGTSSQISGLMSASSVVLLFFIVIFIAYSNSFFMKKRKKEVALYSLLGVRKQQIGLLLFFENLFIGFVSLVSGITIGFLMSKVLLTILVRLMGYSVTAGFTLSIEAVNHTIIVFALLFLFTSLQGYRVIYQFKLIDLFQAEKQGEKIPKASVLATAIGVVSIAMGYYLALQDIMTSKAWQLVGILMPIIIIGLTILGTYLLFHSVGVYILQRIKAMPNFVWKGLNLITSSQLLYRIRGNAKALTLIAVLSATTITAGGAVFGLYYNIDTQVEQTSPTTFAWRGEPQDVPSTTTHQEIEVKDMLVAEGDVQQQFTMMPLASYNLLAKLQNKPAITTLPKNEGVIVDPYYDERYSTDYLQQNVKGSISLKITKRINDSIIGTLTMAGPLIVVNEQAYNEITEQPVKIQTYDVASDADRLAISKELEKILPDNTTLVSQPKLYEEAMSVMGALLFIGSFLGLVFLTATGSIIYFKILSEAEADKEKYTILYKIGVNDKQMLRSIAAQVGVIFGAPLLAGLSHATFALLGFSQIFGLNITKPVLIWMLAYAAIYALYYIFTTRAFYKIVKNARGNS